MSFLQNFIAYSIMVSLPDRKSLTVCFLWICGSSSLLDLSLTSGRNLKEKETAIGNLETGKRKYKESMGPLPPFPVASPIKIPSKLSFINAAKVSAALPLIRHFPVPK